MKEHNYGTLAILFADDAETAGQHYTDFLRHLFQHVYRASDGEVAWQLYQEHRPDVVLLDIRMPKLSGLQVAEKIREHDPDTRIIIATAHVEEEYLLQAVELNLTRFLPKPFSRNTLKEALDKAVAEIDKRSVLHLGNGYSWYGRELKLMHDGDEVKLTTNERAFFSLLASKPGQTFASADIEMRLWPEPEAETDLSSRFKALVKRLRKKLPESCIENIYGEGYRLVLT